MKSVLIALAAMGSMGLLPSFVHAAPGDIYSLGTLGGSLSEGYAINNSGQVAGYAADKNQQNDGFIYSPAAPGGTMTEIGGGNAMTGAGINASGWVVGTSWFFEAQNIKHAYLYPNTSNPNLYYDLGTLHGVGSSFGQAVNNSGTITGYSEISSTSSDVHAFLYTGTPGSGTMADLGTLGGEQSFGYGINASGQVVGQADLTGDTGAHAFLYTGIPGSGGAMADLGVLPGANSDSSTAYAVNASGEVTGTSDTAHGEHAFLYTGTPGHGGAMADLGSLGGLSIGYGIAATGQVVGWSFLSDNSTRHAFVYTGTPGTDGQMIDLNTWLSTVDPTAASQWTLSEALAVNDYGLITGFGTYQGTTRAFVLDASSLVPEPTTLALLLPACGMLLRRRTKK